MTTMQYFFGFIYIAVCLSLIGAILMKTSKNEGFSGSMMGGGMSDTNFRGAKSTEDSIDTVINYIAIAFIVLSLALSYVFT